MNPRSKIFSCLRNLFFAYLLTALLLLGLAFLLYQFHLGESQVHIAVCFIYLLSCFLGGFLTGRVIPRRRFLWGLAFGAVYFLLLILLSLLIRHALGQEPLSILVSFLLCAGGGMFGGMVS